MLRLGAWHRQASLPSTDRAVDNGLDAASSIWSLVNIKYFTHLSNHGLRTYTCAFRYTEWSWTSFKAPLSPFEVRRQLASCPAGLWWALVGLRLLPWRAWRAGAHSRSTQEERGTREMQLKCGWVQEWVSTLYGKGAPYKYRKWRQSDEAIVFLLTKWLPPRPKQKVRLHVRSTSEGWPEQVATSGG